jgi:pterin-4a-carbinolamine dehydratase
VPTLLDETLIIDTLQSLPGWQGDHERIWRDVRLTPEQDAELRRQVTVDAEAMGHRPRIESIEGGTRFTLRTADAGGVTELDIAFASHISDLSHRMAGSEPGIDAVRAGDPVVIVRAAEAAEEGSLASESGVEAPTIGVASVTGGGSPRTPLPDEEPRAPEPGVSTEQTRP